MRRDFSYLFPLISISLLFSTLSYGQAWSGILASSRAINWSNAGLPATLPDGETTPNPWTPPTRTQCGSTISSGASPATINAALAGCSHGTYVLLGPGTFTFASTNLTMYAESGVTLRGSGATSTILKLTGNSVIQWGQAWGTGTATWSAGFSQGATSITVSSIGNLVAGAVIFLEQCDTGTSGNPCTGTPSDNGGLYVCGDNAICQINGGQTGTPQHQQQTVLITSITGSGPYTLKFTPGLYLPNWSSSNSPTINWTPSNASGSTILTYGDGLEDLTVDGTGGDTNGNLIYFDLTYASWVKGVRVLGLGAYDGVDIQYAKNCLFANNYLFADNVSGSADGIDIQEGNDSDNLIINNILTGGVPWEGVGSTEGNVVAYNYGRDAHTIYYENMPFQHNAGSAFMLYEGNQMGEFDEDYTHGTHDLNTWFRNYASGWDPPYQTVSQRGINFDAFARMENAVGNSTGSTLLTNYQSTYSGTVPDFVFQFNGNTNPANDPLVQSTALRWGNCDTVTGTCRFQSSEVPTTLTGNAAPFENTVPSTNSLPCSFFLAGYSSTTCSPLQNGGTGLSWWKVCTSWTTFPTSCAGSQTQPFPPVGPDVTGGLYVNSTAYDIPAAIAFQNLPIDASYQQSFGITASSWSSGTETLIVSGLPGGSIHIMGGFQVTGASGCNSPGGSEFVMTSSTAATISYALGSNPGSCSGGTVKFPDVRQFDERVYMNDPSGALQPPSGLQAVVQ